jgi:hypothetical protein
MLTAVVSRPTSDIRRQLPVREPLLPSFLLPRRHSDSTQQPAPRRVQAARIQPAAALRNEIFRRFDVVFEYTHKERPLNAQGMAVSRLVYLKNSYKIQRQQQQ